MNERIRELDAQAVEYAVGVCDANGLCHYQEYLHVFKEKFAELIVRECVSIAHPKLNDVGEWAAGMRLVQKRLKEHFGVEE
jgi:hypothetical protein